ncbi:hypothetical protein TRIP_E60003 [uncultured Spirochaetota bacterium]|uniref:Uncharacterized protein n=1 Tax=uncultured Spirochaetota bacterium TaxID=460511 RepID=A0A652ZZQ1_9SPIR|nr:hypothetical protein TRIP_E60003 [uncultured Spirochaetota bacterium]
MARMRLGTTQNCVKACAKTLNEFACSRIGEERFRSLMYGFSVLMPAVRQNEELQLLRGKIAELEARLDRAGGPL